MKQVAQHVRSGVTTVCEVPAPLALPHHLVLTSAASLVSAGTERYVVELARKSLLGKARQRPDQVRRVLEKVRDEGLMTTLQQVQAKLDEPMPLGYSAAGTVVAVGSGVQRFKVGDRVAAATPHAEMAAVGQNLCAIIPDGVSFEQAAYTSVAAIALEGVRLAGVQLGGRVLVIGLGLIGQICVALLKAQGCRVFGTDIDAGRVELARTFGADAADSGSPLESVRAFSGGYGVDAVLITAATSSNEPIEFAAEACRHRGRIVLVGVAGLNLPRPPFFQKELEFTVSSSLGPGRGDPYYEEKGIDYPIGFARWTAQRNMEAVLSLMAEGKLPVERLTTHRFPIERAAEAYELVTSSSDPFTGIVIEYPQLPASSTRRIELRTTGAPRYGVGVSLIGAGNFARLVMLPSLVKLDDIQFRGLCTARGMSAEHSGRAAGFAFATTNTDEIWNDESTSMVFIATRHDLHAELVMAALRAGKHVFVEKPLCIDTDQLQRIAAVVEGLGGKCPLLTVGFNRRFAPATRELRGFFEGIEPLSIAHRFSPGPVPESHWTQDETVGGGRIVGEACHAIDTCTAIAGSAPVRVYAESVGPADALRITDDRIFITLRHANGSVSSVSYQAGGDRSAPAERIEVFGGGRSGTIENWDRVDMWRGGRRRSVSGAKDKGHRAEFSAFVEACRKGGPAPIPWSDTYAVTWASLMAVRSLREGFPFHLNDRGS